MGQGRGIAEGRLELGLADRAGLRWAVADVAGPLEEARLRLGLAPIAAVALGRVLAAAALLLRFTFRDVGRLQVEAAGDGPLGRVLGEIDRDGNLRGLVGEPHVATPADGRLKIGWAVGKGVLRVRRERAGRSYVSQVALTTGEIGTDLAHYLEQSEQIRSAVMVGVLPRPDGIAAAGGLLVEALPGTEEAVLARLEQNIVRLGGEVSPALAGGGVEALKDVVLAGFPRRSDEVYALRYRCRCSAEKLRPRLVEIARQDLDALTDEHGQCEAICAFCGARYRFDRADLATTN
ncbi:MAG: Hsp33 family molecular chaperone HslO [Acidobacteria bacterium]|nr:MAG: Hsp33 family molecular chaperone HslO [Acidobacteriota bacterium]